MDFPKKTLHHSKGNKPLSFFSERCQEKTSSNIMFFKTPLSFFEGYLLKSEDLKEFSR